MDYRSFGCARGKSAESGSNVFAGADKFRGNDTTHKSELQEATFSLHLAMLSAKIIQ